MLTLQQMLNGRTHRDLELIARAHNLPFTRREPKAQGLEQLSQALHDGAYEKAFASLTSSHIEALQALVVAGDFMPLYLFQHHFGEIKPYKPWQYPHRAYLTQPTNRHPWRYPASPAERLYHLGYIIIHDWQMVGIVAEVKDYLPPLHITPSAEGLSLRSGGTEAGKRADLLRDIAALLGVLMQSRAEPLHGRWLSLSVLREINERLQIKDAMSDVRSELQTGRLRWLHYLAQVAGLLSVQDGAWLPTVDAWRWLSAPAEVQWDSLMQAVERDLSSRDPVWRIFRFPDIGAETWRAVRHLLDDLSPAHAYRVKDIFTLLKPYLLPDARYDIACLLRDIFAWSGVLLLQRGRIYPRHPLTAPPENGHLSVSNDDIRLTLPPRPSPELTTLLSFAQVENHSAIINAEAVTSAVRQGMDTTGIIATIHALSNETLPADAQAQIQAWVTEAHRLTLQNIVVLHSPDADLIDRIRTDWRLAEYVVERLSPHHLAVVAEKAHELLSRLNRRDIQVTSFVQPRSRRRITNDINPDMAEYLLLAVRTYQLLHSRLDASICIPKALTHWLSAQVDDPASIEHSAEILLHAFEKTVPHESPLFDDQLQDNRSIHRLLRLAAVRKQAITIDYYSPTYGESTHTVSIQAIEEEGDVTFVYTYSHTAQAERTFHLGRILRVHEEVAREQAV